jgi:hypothetical protein
MVVSYDDVRSGWRAVGQAFGGTGPAPLKPGKYSLLQKLYHVAIACVVLALVATGILMLLKIDTPLWRRNPYWFSDYAWGVIYSIHDLCAMSVIKGEPTLAERIEAVEQAYEFMLAYAAQGREDEGGSVRQFLERAAAALDGLSTAATASPQPRDTTSSEAFGAFLEILDDDARKARAALQLVLAQKSIRSQLVDNLNASIHLRALLTDIFLIDEALKSGKD